MVTSAELVNVLIDCREARHQLPRADLPTDSVAQHYADLALQERGTPNPADRVAMVVDLWTLVAAEQLGSIAVLIAAGEPIFALFPVCRSAIEHSCLAVWTVDPETSPETICARAALGMLRSHQELCAAASRMGGKGSDVHQRQRAQLRALRAAIEREFPIGTDLEKSIIASEAMPQPTDVLKHFGSRWGNEREWQGMYDYLCTVTHPTLAPYEFIDVDKRGNVTFNATEDFLERLVRATIVPYLKALEHYAAYFHWNHEPLDALFDRINLVLPNTMN